MSLRCHFFGHRRSRSRATFDEKHQHWISECKRCCTPLVRQADGTWEPAPPAPDGKLEPVEVDASANAAGRDREAPGVADGAAEDSADGGGPAALERSGQTVELAAP